MDDETAAAAAIAVAACEEAAGSAVVGAYFFGSAAFDDYVAGVSDLDVLAVVPAELGADQRRALVELLAPVGDVGPSFQGLDLYVVTSAFAAAPTFPPTTEVAAGIFKGNEWVPDMTFGDSADLGPLLALEICRRTDRIITGPAPSSYFADVPRRWLLSGCLSEIRYWQRRGPGRWARTAVLNACRAMLYLEEDVLASKFTGGRWAIDRLGFAPVIEAALASQTGDTVAIEESAVTPLLDSVAVRLEQALA